MPACQLTGQAPLASPPDTTAPAGCTAQWQAQGTQFKAIVLPLGDTVLGITVNDANRRNLLAHWCFGSPQLADLGANLLGFAPRYGGFDQLDPTDLTVADLPLAVFYWDGKAVGFVDNWSARRRITAPDPVSSSWSGVISDRRTADGQARLLQFQEQASELVDSGAANTVVAATTFPLLPPVGFLPIGVQQVPTIIKTLRFEADRAGLARLLKERFDVAGATTTPEPGFDPFLFFSGSAQFGLFLDWEITDLLLRQSWENTPVATTSPPDDIQQAPLKFYFVVQNFLAGLKQGPSLYMVFVKNYIWLEGDALPPVLLSWPG
jgi:hypothetical protein